ncbi:MAG: biotin--[acetyl-CoA-carboxylase] ligase, partial [Desulfobulbaceae bacterium]|nr:biotin--[acetyl-CoA-carboxylase] ligase [Candidatus Desulfobia pelagia]
REIARRSFFFPVEPVSRIFRYGGAVASTIHYSPFLSRGMEKAREMITDYEKQGNSFPSGKVVAAERLESGKGRFQRSWYAPSGGIWLTMVLVNTLLPEISRFIPLAAGVACCETVLENGIPGKIKWVNDVHVDGRKVAGILTETMVGPESGEEYILIGVGLNVNNEKFPPELADTAGSLRTLGGREYDVNLVATDLLAKLVWNIGLLHFEEEQRLLVTDEQKTHHFLLLEQWQNLSDSAGRRVLFGYDVQKEPQYQADVLGIADDGGLQMRLLEDNSMVTEYSGEIIYLPEG